MEIQLITKADFLPYRAIADNTDVVKRLEPMIVEAQRLDFINLLGTTLYYALIANITAYKEAVAINEDYVATETQQEFLDLLNGKTYDHTSTHSDTVTKVYPGLKPVLVYLSYKRFVNRDNVRPTPNGFVIKTNMESQPISATQIREEASRAEADARMFYTFAEDYMRDNDTFYKKYRPSCDASGGNSLSDRLTAPRNRNRLSRGYRNR